MAAAETYTYAEELLALLRDPDSPPTKRRLYVSRFQQAHGGLTIDGLYGPLTRAALAHTLSMPESEMPPATAEPRRLPPPGGVTTSTPEGTRPASPPMTPATSTRPPRWFKSAVRLAEWIPSASDADTDVATFLASVRATARTLLDAWHLTPFVLGQEPPRGTRTRVRTPAPPPDRGTLQRLWDGSSDWVREQAQRFQREVHDLYDAYRRGQSGMRRAVLDDATGALGDMLGSPATWIVLGLGLLGLYVATR